MKSSDATEQTMKTTSSSRIPPPRAATSAATTAATAIGPRMKLVVATSPAASRTARIAQSTQSGIRRSYGRGQVTGRPTRLLDGVGAPAGHVADRDDPDRAVVLDHRQVAEPVVEHQPGCVGGRH